MEKQTRCQSVKAKGREPREEGKGYSPSGVSSLPVSTTKSKRKTSPPYG